EMGIPTIIQEQNSYPGITNKMLANKAKAICVAYDGLERFFSPKKIRKTGNPVRSDLLSIENLRAEAIDFYHLDPTKKTVVVLGGSLGARRINQLIENEIQFFQQQNTQVIWQCGKIYYPEYAKYNEIPHINVYDFIDRMDLLYAAADVIISRAGASSVSELAIVGKPVIFVPSPNVAEDHQTKNAQSVVQKNGAVLIREADLDQQFEEQIQRILTSEHVATALSINLKKMALPHATKDIVEEIKKWIR